MSEFKTKYYSDPAWRENYLEKQRQEVTCECGAKVKKWHLSKHRKTKKHIMIIDPDSLKPKPSHEIKVIKVEDLKNILKDMDIKSVKDLVQKL